MRYSWLVFMPIAIIVLLAVIVLAKRRSKKTPTAKKNVKYFSHSRKVKMLPAYKAAKRRYYTLLIVAGIFFVLSLFSVSVIAARPVYVSVEDIDYETHDIMLCLDASGSTTAFKTEMLEYFSRIVLSTKLNGERIGIGVFAKKSALVSPLTNDYDSLMEVIDDLTEHFSSYSSKLGYSSAIGDGLINCVNSFDRLAEDGRAQSIILVTDNELNSGTANILQAAAYAKRYNITLFGVDLKSSGDMGATAREFRKAVLSTGGLYYTIAQKNLSAKETVDQILKQEKAKYDGGRQYTREDNPQIAAIVSAITLIGLLALLWGLKL